MDTPTVFAIILAFSVFLNCKAAGVGELPEIESISSDEGTGAATTTTTTLPIQPTAHTTAKVTVIPNPQVNTTTPSANRTTTVPSNQTTAHSTVTSPQVNTTTPSANRTTTVPSNQTTAHSTVTSTPQVNTTTPSANITTTVLSNQTTAHSTVTSTPQVNTTTSSANSTTTIPSNYTTTQPSNSTTHTTTNTTHPVTVPTVIPTPTYSPEPSPPATGNYSVSDKGANCIMALMGIEIIIHTNKDTYFNIAPDETKTSGNCGKFNANLNLTFNAGFINFNFVKDNKSYYADQIQALLQPLNVEQLSKQTLMQTKLGTSYKCNSKQRFPLGNNLTLLMINARLQAFEIQHNNFGTESECPTDHNSVIAVAVGLTVVIVIILALIIYLIYRRKKSSGYQRI
ncbi:lysosome-associated membrane glycoprotein 3 [Ambystoma mexicanum]|uniref:lysosome-associated membrane glycoprotein 3 n=1 Tax=Ambystoma mexicanum TaxID=8296 RepID=UPI0037E76D9E